MARGRARTYRTDPRPRAHRVTHCPKGHEYTAENSYIHPVTGHRKCRACQYEWSRRAFRRHLYGISLEQYEWLLSIQGGRCAICGSETNSGVALSVDHDHQTGQVRGILCDPCNIGIGGLREDPALLSAAIAYVQRPLPAIPTLGADIESEVCFQCGADGGRKPARRIIDGRTRPVCPNCNTALGSGRS